METATENKETLVEMAKTTRPFISKELWDLLEEFMEFMRNLPDPEGGNYRAVYDGMSPAELIKRLLTKRPIVFYKGDSNVLRNDPKKLYPGRHARWNEVARTLEKERTDWPYLREYISYDEILLSAYVSMSTPTYFVSDGSLKAPESISTKLFVPQGILCGLVGARLTKWGFMEHRFVFPRDEDNSNFDDVHLSDAFWIKNVYAHAFPEGKIPTMSEISKNKKPYEKIYVDGINVVYFKKRLALTVQPFIEEAAQRGREKNQLVVASVPPIGAGVWSGGIGSKIIINMIVTVVLEYLDDSFDLKNLENLQAIFLPETDSEVYSNFRHCKQISSIKLNTADNSLEVTFKGNHKVLTIFNQFRYVAQLLPEKFKSCLIVAGFAWDGNSYPGNEYWKDSFGSFDPQAILCSYLGQFQNPEVNIDLASPQRIKFY